MKDRTATILSWVIVWLVLAFLLRDNRQVAGIVLVGVPIGFFIGLAASGRNAKARQ